MRTIRRPRDWSPPPEALLHAAPVEAPELAATLRLYALAILLNRGEVTAARDLLDSLGPDIAPSPALRREFLL